MADETFVADHVTGALEGAVVLDKPEWKTLRASGIRRRNNGMINPGSDYSLEEVEFMRALDRYKLIHNRPNPTCTEVLGVLKSLGYRKTEVG